MKIFIAGDFCPIGRTDKYLKNESYEELFNGYEKIIQSVDYAIVNFECPVTKSTLKINKTGPCLKTENLNSFKALKFAGFDLLTLANNHIQDYSGQGVVDTITNAQNNGFDIVGAGKNLLEASKPFIKNIKGLKIGFVNIAENEFCSAEIDQPGAYTFDLIENIKLIKELKSITDKVILIYHGGREHYQLPSPDQRKRLRHFITCGVDAIVAHHTHCVSGYEYFEGKPIIYSLGNFIFDYKKKYQKGKWTEGMSVILHLQNNNFEVELIPHHQGQEEDSTLKVLKDSEKVNFLNKISKLNEIIEDDIQFMKEWEEYLESQEKFYLASIYIKNVYIRFLFMKGLLPIRILKSKHNTLILNLMRCEAHHEISKGILNNKK